VFTPKELPDLIEGDGEGVTEVAVLVAGGVPQDLVPLGDVSGLEVAKVFDLDGDGISVIVQGGS
jgi:hypothetical protein